MDEFIKKEIEKVEQLKQRLGGVPSGSREGSLAEELERARDSARQLRRLLGERDLAEAKGEAERAEGSLERAAEHLDEMAEARRARDPTPEPETRQARGGGRRGARAGPGDRGRPGQAAAARRRR